MRRFVLALFIISFAGSFASPQAGGDERVVSVYSWSDYIDPNVLEDFTKQTGIKVIYDSYDSNEALETKLMLGNSGYDVVVPSALVLQRAIAAGLLQKLDTSKLANAANLSPRIMAHLAVDDPDNRYAVNYMWFTAGIAFDADKARARLNGALPDSWDVIFKPDILEKFADCGVEIIDDPQAMFSIALIYLKLNPNTRNLNDLERAAALLNTLKRNVKKFNSSEYVNALANGDICLAVGWSGDAVLARNRADEADSGVSVGYAVPKEGSLIALDNLAIPSDAPHVDAAYKFIDFLLRPEIAARNTDATGFASGVSGVQSLAAPAIANDKTVFPDSETMAHLFSVRNYDLPTLKYVAREWTRIKSGK